MSRKERKNQLIELLYNATEYMTITEMGRGIGLKRTPYLLSLLSELETDGWICVVGNRAVGNLTAVVFDLTVEAEQWMTEHMAVWS